MREQIHARLSELQRQLHAGQLEVQQLQDRETYVRETTLRISGAIQVLEELLVQPHSIEQISQTSRNAESADDGAHTDDAQELAARRDLSPSRAAPSTLSAG